ncbi:MAG: GTPase, partial [Hydrogenophaga sp.]
MSIESPLLQIAVVGHTNAGKTSLLRTLTRQA